MSTYKRIIIDGMSYYGKHLIYSGESCNENLLSIRAIEEFLLNTVDRIHMVRFGNPIVERFGTGSETGISGVQLIETSSITIHTNDENRDIYFDVFSCKGFNEEDVIKLIDKTFEPKTYNYHTLLRK